MNIPVDQASKSKTSDTRTETEQTTNNEQWMKLVKSLKDGPLKEGMIAGFNSQKMSNKQQKAVEESVNAYPGTGLMEIKVDGDTTIADKATIDFVQKMRDDLKNKVVSEDSDEAKLLDLLDAQSALQNGYDLYGYAEAIDAGGTTYRQTQDKPTHMEGVDVKDMLNETEISDKITELMSKEGIANRYNDALKGAREAAPQDEVNAYKDNVMKALFDGDKPNLEFENYIIKTKEQAVKDGDEETQDKLDGLVSDYFEVLKTLDPERYIARKQEFDQNMMTHQLDEYMAHPELVGAESQQQSFRPVIDMLQTAVNSVLMSADKGSKAFNQADKLKIALTSVNDLFSKLSTDQFGKMMVGLNTINKAIEELKEGKKGKLTDGELEQKTRDLTNKFITERLDGLPENAKSGFRTGINDLSKCGSLSAFAGTMNMVSGCTQLANGKWDDMSSDQRIAAVRDLVGGLSFGSDFAKFGAHIYSNLTAGVTGKEFKAVSWLGLLDENMPDIWKKRSPVRSEEAAFVKSVNQIVDGGAKANEKKGEKFYIFNSDGSMNLSDAEKQSLSDTAKNLGSTMKAPGSIAGRIGQTFLRFMGGSGLDLTGGVMDIVTGVHALKRAETDLQTAGASLSIGSGSASTAMALCNTITMFAPAEGTLVSQAATGASAAVARSITPIVSTVLRAVVAGARFLSPIFALVGTALGVAGLFIAEAIEHQKMQKVTDEQGAFFGRLATLGVTKSDWGDKLEYARYAAYMYGGREAPADQSLFAFQKDEWKHFQDTKSDRGSSLNRLAPYLHFDADLKSKNLFEKELAGLTTYDRGKDYEYQTADWRPWADTDTKAGNESESTTDYRIGSVSHIYDKEFYDENKSTIDVISKNWDNWNGADAIVSIDDLNQIVNDGGRSQEERDAAKFLIDKGDFRDAIDSINNTSGMVDGKISSDDLNAWLIEIGGSRLGTSATFGEQFYSDNKPILDVVVSNWDKWNGRDSIVSENDLNKIADDTGRSDEERNAARFLLDNNDFRDMLDAIRSNGDGNDTKISSGDLNYWLENVAHTDVRV